MESSRKGCLFILVFLTGLLNFRSPVFSQEVTGWTNLGLSGGVIYDIAIDPFNHDKMFAGSYLGDGLYLTEDGGATWRPVETENEPEGEGTFKNHAVYAVKIAPSNPNVIWVAHNYWVEKSTDGGRLWNHIFNREIQRDCRNCGGAGDDFRLCQSVAVDPGDPGTVYVGAAGPGNSFSSGAIYRTEDGGATWTKMNGGADFDYAVVDIAIDPQDSNIVWAVTNKSGGKGVGAGGTLYRGEIDGQGVDSWMPVFSNDRSFRDVEVKPDDSNSIFTANDFGIFRHYFDEDEWKFQGILQPSTWPPPLPEDEEWAYFVNALAFDPQNPDVLYAHWRYSYQGATYSRIARGQQPPYAYEDWEIYPVDQSLLANKFYTLTVHPSNSDWIFGGTNGLGVFKSQDHGQSWTPINNGINAVWVRDLAIDPDDPAHMFACTISGLYEKKGDTWTRLFTYDARSIRFHPADNETLYIGLIGCLAKTTSGGAGWSYTCGFKGNVDDIAIDPVDTDTLFVAAGTEIHKSTDGGSTFAKLLDGENQAGEQYVFNVVAIDPANHQHIFAGGGNFYAPGVPGDLWESRAGGAEGSWKRTSLQNVIVNALLIDPRDSTTMYAGCGYSGGTEVPVYKTSDGGLTWTASYEGIPGLSVILNDVWGSSATDVFTVGSSGAILHYDGISWSEMSSGTQQDLYGVWGSSGADVFAGGVHGAILHYDGGSWSTMNSGTTKLLRDLWGSSSSDMFAVGDDGVILHYDGSSWTEMASGIQLALYDVWGSSGTDVFAVGSSGTILHYNDSSWSAMSSGTTELLRGVWGSAGADIFAVGDLGTIVHYDGSRWSAMSSGTTKDLSDIWGSAGDDVFAVGDDGTIIHYDGSKWSAMSSDTGGYLSGVWGSAGDNVFAVGDDGTILHYDGSSWSVMRPGGKPWNAVTDLEFHRENKNVIYTSTNHAGVYVSPDQAGNWLNLGTPDYDVYAISTSSLYSATQGGLLQCTGTGVITGQVTDATWGKAVDTATVFTDGGVKTICVNGEYMMLCPAGIFDVTAVADGYANETEETIPVLGGDVAWVNIAMESGNPDPSLPSGSSNTSSGSSACFIATAADGSHLAKQVEILRSFKDQYLLPHAYGEKLAAFYYRLGKPIARYVESHPWTKPPVRIALYPLIGLAWLAVTTNAATKAFIALGLVLLCASAIKLKGNQAKETFKRSQG